MKHLLVFFAAWAICLCAAAAPDAAQRPQVVPALQSWCAARGTLTLPQEGRIVVEADSLRPVAETLARDLQQLMGWRYAVTGRAGILACDPTCAIILTCDESRAGKNACPPSHESYTLAVASAVRIAAPTRQGALWGTRTLLQMLHNGRGTLPCGTARDWPDYPRRGFMLDTGRKFFSMDFLRQWVKILSFYKMNELQVHLNDNGFPQFFGGDWQQTQAAFRLQSDRFPGLTARDGSYTKQEFRALQRLGREYGVNVIPEIDMPAHALAFTHYKPEIASTKYGRDHLDLYNEETYRFLDALLDEYLGGNDPVFEGPDVHIGTDEYNRAEAERFRWFTDRYLRRVQSYGKTARMWGSLRMLRGETPVQSKDVVINAWSYDWIDPAASLAAGYKLINTCDTYLYIVPAAGYYRDTLDTRWLYEAWRVGRVNAREELPEHTPGLLGAMFAVWNDHPGNGISQQDVHVRAFPAMQAIAQKTWRGADTTPYADFHALCLRTPEAPGVNLAARLAAPYALCPTPYALHGTDSLLTAVPEVGYPYTVELDLCPDSVQAVSAVLFRGPHSEVLANYEGTGRIAFRRDGYTYEFAAPIPAARWTHLRICGDWRGTSLAVDGGPEERLEGRTAAWYNPRYRRVDKMHIQQTLIFPLAQIGSAENGFKGQVRGLQVSQEAISH